jgi:hypothetical protein
MDQLYRSMDKYDKLAKGIQSIEKQLIKVIKDVDEHILGRVCYSLDEEYTMEAFLKKAAKKVDVRKISLDDLPHVLRAY